MERTVLDSSALLAVLQNERGKDAVLQFLPFALMSVVNAVEVQARLMRSGVPADRAWILTKMSVSELVPFDEIQAEICARLLHQTRGMDVSLADCVCISLAVRTGLPMYTADRKLASLDLDIDVRLIR